MGFYYRLRKIGYIYKEYTLESAHYSNGDHIFNILGRDLNSDINNPQSYGNNAVLIDSWRGAVFPANATQNLYDYYNIKINRDQPAYNFLAQINPKYHRIKTVTSGTMLASYSMKVGAPDKNSAHMNEIKTKKLASLYNPNDLD